MRKIPINKTVLPMLKLFDWTIELNALGMTGVIIYEIAHPAIPAPGEGV